MPLPITCAACQKTFSIADDVYERKVKGRVVTIKCKQCHAGIRVDGTKESPDVDLSESVRPPPAAVTSAATAELASEPATTKPALTKDASNSLAAQFAPAAAAAARTAAPAGVPEKAVATPSKAAVPLGTAPKAGPAAAARVMTSGAKPPPAAPAMKQALAPATAAPKAPVVAATPKAAPVGVRPPPAAPTLKAQPPAPVFAPEAVPPAPDTLWAVDYPDGQDRELTRMEIQQALASGTINPTTLVWREGMDEWLELGQVAELASLTEPMNPGPAPARAKAASAPNIDAPRAKAASAPNINAPPARAKAASAPSIDLPPPRPRAASAPSIDLPPARPKAASAPNIDRPAPTPIPKAPVAASTPPSFPPVPGTPAMNAFSGDLLARPTAAANPASSAGAAPVVGLDEYPRKSKTPLILAVLAILALLAFAIYFLTRPGDELPPPAPISALPAAAPTTVHPSTPETATADRTPSAQSAASPRANAVLEPPSSAPQTTPNAGFAEQFANAARSADEKHGVSGPAQRFDPAAAKAALANAARLAEQCREKNGPIGKASVVVTFEPSGKVSAATISDAPFAGTTSGDCIAGAFKGATVPPFSGLPGTVTKVISFQ